MGFKSGDKLIGCKISAQAFCGWVRNQGLGLGILEDNLAGTDMWSNLAKIMIYGCLTVFDQKLTWEEIGKW